MIKSKVIVLSIFLILMSLIPFLLKAQSNEVNHKWEYKVLATGMSKGVLEEKLNKLAAEGWELVNGTDQIVYLKRQPQ